MAAENIPITNGNFEAVDGAGAPVGWSVSDSALVSVVSEGGSKVLQLRTSAAGNASATQTLLLDPTWGVLRFRYRVRVKGVSLGKESWNDARIALTFYGADKKVTHMVAGNWTQPNSGWVEASQTVALPTGAVSVRISPAIFATVAEWCLDDLRVELLARRGEGIDAELPPGQSLTWGREPVEEQGPRRSVVCLNGLWQFQPAKGPAFAAPLSSGRGWMRVPGNWRGSPMPGLTAGSGPAWEGFHYDSPAAWYTREIQVPAAWKGRKILLDLRRVSTDAVVHLDGKEAGRVSWPGGEVDLTALVTPGRKHALAVRVVASSDAAEVVRFMGMGEGQILKEKAVLSTRGIIGDVLLTSRPEGAVMTGLVVRTSVREKKFSVEAGLEGVSRGTVLLTAVVRDGKGAEAKRFSTNVRVAAEADSVAATWGWADPDLWDIDHPALYTLEFSAKGAGLEDTRVERFGFREFRVDGKRFLLNEKEIRLRPAPVHQESGIAGTRDLIVSALEGLRWAGFNTYEMWPWDRNERGAMEWDELWCQEADRLGMLLITPALSQGQFVSEWAKSGVKESWASNMAPQLRRLANHPSIICWVTGANRFGHGQDQNPEAIGNKAAGSLGEPNWKRSAAYGEDAAAMIRRVDPTRPVFMHAGGPVGDIYTANNYLCLIPLQEREEWPSRWAATGDMPVLMVEFGTPLYTTFHRGRRGYAQANTSEPLYSEFCAIYQGAEAYRGENPAYRDLIASTYVKEFLWKTWHPMEMQRIHEGFNRLETLFNVNTFRAWRTWGVTGGILPWGNGHGWLREAGGGPDMKPFQPKTVPLPAFAPGSRGYYRPETTLGLARYFRPEGMPLTSAGWAIVSNSQETLAWITGAPDFTDKTHHYRAGERVAKQLALINDSRSAKRYRASWKVELGGAVIASGNVEGELPPAQTKFLPVAFAIPAVLASDRVAGLVRMECSLGEAKHVDLFPFHAFAAVPQVLPPIALLDPQGETGALLKYLGVSTQAWDGKDTSRLLVIGRNAFAKGKADPASVEKALRSGARVLLMAQDPDWMRQRLGLRVSWQLTRRAFPAIPGHPALSGLDAEALRDWAGTSRLVPATDTALSESTPNRTPDHGWRWGARHAVSSAAIEVPHRSGWRPILACEFDSAYTPLAELALGMGNLIVCTLDLEDHAAADPAAERLARAILAHAGSAKAEERGTVAYLGGDAGASLLAASGIKFTVASTLPERGLAFIGADAAPGDAALEAFLKKGGKLVFLPRRGESAPLGVRLKKIERHGGSLQVPAWAACRGILPGELRRRVDGEAWTVASGADAIGADGLLAELRKGPGVAVFFQLDAAALEADRVSYHRYTRWRWTRALTQIAANLGAACEGDDRLVKPIAPAERVSLAGTWKAELTHRLDPAGANDQKPKDPGIGDRAKELVAKDADERGMQDVPVSKEWENYGGLWVNADGEAVFRKTLEIPPHWAGRDLVVSLGPVDDFDTAYFDGEAVGSTDINVKNFWSAPRRYTVPARLATAGRHVIAVRVFDHFGGGGMVGTPEQLSLTPKEPLTPPAAGMYYPDWRDDFPLGDDPYRYYRW
ncbi:MAG: beta-galactosidase [Spirochaetes bacterium]|nr:beta-galactosidase [Spirochaetota bacterium]